MILENGVIRTMDPSLPAARALAIPEAHRHRFQLDEIVPLHVYKQRDG